MVSLSGLISAKAPVATAVTLVVLVAILFMYLIRLPKCFARLPQFQDLPKWKSKYKQFE